MSENLTNQDILDYFKISKSRNIKEILEFYEIKVNPPPTDKQVRYKILEIEAFEWNIYAKITKQKL